MTPGGVPIVNHASRFDVVNAGSGPTAGPMRVNTSRQILIHDPAGFLILLMQRAS